MEEIVFKKKLFGGEIEFVVYDASEIIAREIIEEAYSEGLRLQKIFNFYDEKSELSKLNKARKKRVSKDLLGIIKKSLEISKITNGAYDVTLGKAILERKKGKEIELGCSYKDVLIVGDEVTLSHPDAEIDLGSIAKGYIADKLSNFLEEKGLKEFLIDARGDIIVKGKRTHVLGIKNPRKEGELLSIKLKNQAVATSGDYNQYVGTFNKSHILNQKDAISISVVCKNLEEADVYATSLFVCSNEKKERIAKTNKHIKVLVVKTGNNLRMLNGFEKLVYR